MAPNMLDAPHPCFNAKVKGSHGRVHLPVAPLCNIKCNYCDRKHDCVNESRPGVTSAVLAPHQALAYLEQVLKAEPRISVVGLAGPGDPLANPEATLETLRLVKERFPSLLICLSSNGLAAPAYLDELASVGVTHMTITVNAVDPRVGAQVYSYVRDGKVVYRGQQAAELILSRQEEAVRGLKERGITVKLNTIVLPGVNQDHVEEVARWGAELGADLMNLMPLYPNPGTPFALLPEPSRQVMQMLRDRCEAILPQMRHCTRCRSDAVGILGQDRSGEMAGCLSRCAQLPPPPESQRPFVAVASREGVLVNLHLGQATEMQIWGPGPMGGFQHLESRPAPEPGGGAKRWQELAERLSDCRAVLVSGIGETPRQVLAGAGVQAVEMTGFIDQGLSAIYAGQDLGALAVRKGKACCVGGKGGGGGDGMGCM